MNNPVEYTTKNLYGEFKPEDVCFVVAKSYGYINEFLYLTGDINTALSLAKENDYNIFCLQKEVCKRLFRYLFNL